MNEAKWTAGVSNVNHLRGQCAFIDRVVVSIIHGTLRKPFGENIYPTKDGGIAGPRSHYSRCLHGNCKLTGNYFQLRYGPLKKAPRFPLFRLIVISSTIPVTGTQVVSVLNSLFMSGCAHYIGEVELTFDIAPPKRFACDRQIFTSARRSFVHWSEKPAFYFGSRKSAWQLRVYSKTATTLRLEFIFRRAFLLKRHITMPDHVLKLATLDLSPMASFRSISQAKLRAAIQGSAAVLRQWICLPWAMRGSLQLLGRAARQDGIDLEPLLKPCVVEERMRRMQRRLSF